MRRNLILGRLHPDLACAIALGLVEDPRVVVNTETINLYDDGLKLVGTVRSWFSADDPLDVATRDYLLARREAGKTTAWRPGQNGWGAASAARTRDLANKTAVQAKERARSLLTERGVLTHARKIGLRLIGVD